MYARQPPDPRFPRHIPIPHNYAGNAFRPPADPPPPIPEPPMEPEEPMAEEEPAVSDVPVHASPIASLFHRPGGLGTEELLLLGVLFLVSQSEGKDDLLFLLILLLLMG